MRIRKFVMFRYPIFNNYVETLVFQFEETNLITKEVMYNTGVMAAVPVPCINFDKFSTSCIVFAQFHTRTVIIILEGG